VSPREAPLDAAAGQTSGVTPEDEAARRSDFDRLAALMAALPDGDRELLALKYGAGMTNRAIARVAGRS
jgi:RNA polymerase sigma-70 factor, ECF subfamily